MWKLLQENSTYFQIGIILNAGISPHIVGNFSTYWGTFPLKINNLTPPEQGKKTSKRQI